MSNIVYQSDIYLVVWNGSATFNIYVLANNGKRWDNIDAFTIYFEADDRLDEAKNIAETHMKEVYEDF